MEQLNIGFENSKSFLSYFGNFSDEITDKIIGISEFYLQQTSDVAKLKNKVSFLIAECFQNIVRHGSNQESQGATNNSDFFQINILNDRVVLSSCNSVDNDLVGDIEKKINQVNSLNAEELKKLYTELLSNGGFSAKGGAGLGLIEMSRKSGLPLKYNFIDKDGKSCKFLLVLEIIEKKNDVEQKVELDKVEKIYRDLLNQKSLIVYKGDFSRDTIIPLIDMLQLNFQKMKTTSASIEKRLIITAIESLQNVSKHGMLSNGVKEGILAISKNNSNYIIQIGNYISDKDYSALSNNLNNIKKLNPTELSSLYKKKLLDNDISAEGNAGLGLLEIYKNSNGNFEYEFVKTENNNYFFSIKITL